MKRLRNKILPAGPALPAGPVRLPDAVARAWPKAAGVGLRSTHALPRAGRARKPCAVASARGLVPLLVALALLLPVSALFPPPAAAGPEGDRAPLAAGWTREKVARIPAPAARNPRPLPQGPGAEAFLLPGRRAAWSVLPPLAQVAAVAVPWRSAWQVRCPVLPVAHPCAPARAPARSRVGGRDLVVRGRVEQVDVTQLGLVPFLAVPLLPGAGGGPLLDAGEQLYGFEIPGGSELLDSDGRPLRWAFGPSLRQGQQAAFPQVAGRPSGVPPLGVAPAGGLGRTAPVLAYRDLARKYAARFGLEERLLLAIIHAESQGRPSLVSSRNAVGLMQVKPHLAGTDVVGLCASPLVATREGLLDPDLNVRAGAAYLRLLATRYFGRVEDPRLRHLCVIAAFNAGPGCFLSSFGPGTAAALAHINGLTPEALYEEIVARLSCSGTGRYLARVLALERLYAQLGY